MYKKILNIIKFGSKTFYIGTIFLKFKTRINILIFYYWCRYCDNIIDNYIIKKKNLKKNQIKLLKIKIIHSYKKYIIKDFEFILFKKLIFSNKISNYLIFEHLNGYKMDVKNIFYNNIKETILYCYRIGGILGIIIANIINIQDIKILISACELGIAFQITNIARDILLDKKIERCYLPNIWLKNEFLNINNYTKFNNHKSLINVINRLLNISNNYYKNSIIGLNIISLRNAFIIIIIRNIYRAINFKIKTANIKSIKNRQYTNFIEKLILCFFSILQLIFLKIKKKYFFYKLLKLN